MNLDSYRITRTNSYSNPRQEMLREKKLQINNLYEFAVDREDNVLLNKKSFSKSPRIFDRKFVDSTHHKITVETIFEYDWMECGDYLEYDGMVWLCLNSYSFHGLYCRATFMSCDLEIYWINEKGELKSQYVIDQNAAQSSIGETENSVIVVGDTRHILKMQCNNDTIMLDSPQRFCIDKNVKRPTCYKITQNDNTSYNYGKGLCCVTVTESQLDTDKDELITLKDGKKVWVCDCINKNSIAISTISKDIISSSTHISDTKVNISKVIINGNTNLKVGIPRIYSTTVINIDGTIIENDKTLVWNIISDFDIKQEICENGIKLFVDDNCLIGQSFLLQAIKDNKVLKDVKINIVEIF